MKKHLLKRQTILCIVLCLTSMLAMGQYTTTFEPGSGGWMDATVINSASTNNTNYGNYDQISVAKFGSAIHRSLIKVDLSMIPSGTTIQSAKLILTNYSYGPAQNGNSGSNAFYVRQILQSWEESTVTWNNQPSLTTANQVAVPSWTASTPNPQEIDMTAMVQSMANSPTSNKGFMLKLQTETGSDKARNLASSNYSTQPTWRPKLVVVTTVPITLSDRRDYIFGSLSQTQITSGILNEFGLDLADPSLYDGVIRTNNDLTIDTWRALYAQLMTATINPNSQLKSLKIINDTLDTKWRAVDTTGRSIDVPVVFARYQTIVSNASPSMITVSNNRLVDVPNRTQNPYVTKYAFGAAPTMSYDLDGKVTFRFPSAAFVNSSDKTMASFSVDFGDGAGYQTVTLNTPIAIQYPSAGTKTLLFKFTDTGNVSYYGHSKFIVYEASIAQRYSTTGIGHFRFPRSIPQRCSESTFPNPEGTSYGATVTVVYGTYPAGTRPDIRCTPRFIKPLIVVKGFDPSHFSAFGTDRWDYELFIKSSKNGGFAVATSEGSDLNGKLADEGFDLIYVDYDQGTGDISQLASLLRNIIEWVNANKISNPTHNNIREKNYVIGQSMGGLIARYALWDMEKRNLSSPAHEVSILVTQDTPHRGANVPQGFQSLVNKLAPKSLAKIGLAANGITGAIIGSTLDIQDVVPAVRQARQLLSEPATRQMLAIQDNATNTFLDGDYRSMVTPPVGHTPTFAFKAMSNGSECGEGQVISPSAQLFNANLSLSTNRLLITPGTDVLANTPNVAPVARGLSVLSDVPFQVLMPFSGKTWKTKIVVNSTSTTGIGEVMTAKLEVQKSILGLVSLNFTLVDEATTVSNGIHLDSRPGGFYNLQSKTAKIGSQSYNAYPISAGNIDISVAKTFCFVTTASALDIVTTPITGAAMNSPYTNGSNSTYPSRASNFKTQERDFGDNVLLNSRYNSKHIQFNFTNTTWLLNILRGNDPVVSCSYSCNGGSGATMSGPTQVCSSPVVYIVSNIPPGAAISWTCNGPMTIPPNSSGTSVTATPTVGTDGDVYIQAFFVTENCGTTKASMWVRKGNPVWPNESTDSNGNPTYVYQGATPYAGEQIQLVVIDYPAKTGPVTVQGGNKISGGDGWMATVFPYPGQWTVSACAPGPCGEKCVYQLFTVYGSSARAAESDYTYYPNPADDELIITDTPAFDGLAVKAMSAKSTKGTVSVRLTDATGNVVQAGGSEEGSTITLDTSQLPDGLYYLVINDGGKEFSERIVIKH